MPYNSKLSSIYNLVDYALVVWVEYKPHSFSVSYRKFQKEGLPLAFHDAPSLIVFTTLVFHFCRAIYVFLYRCG